MAYLVTTLIINILKKNLTKNNNNNFTKKYQIRLEDR